MKASVALIACPDYEPQFMNQAVRKGLGLLGDMKSLFKPGQKVLLKPNLLAADPPEKAVTTHPAVFRAVALALQDLGVNLVYGDSPAIGSTERVAKKAGLYEVAQELQIELADFNTARNLQNPGGVQNRSFMVASGVLDCGALVSLPKLKTHGLMGMTGAIKNQFGCIPGIMKGEFHLKLPGAEEFARMLVDLNLALCPRLYVMDGVVAMEGNGPRGGKSRQTGLLAFSTDPVALDASICRLLGLNPDSIPTIKAGAKAGLGEDREEYIELLGDFALMAGPIPFKEARPSGDHSNSAGWVRQGLIPKPVIDEKICKSCGICVECCPVDPPALVWPAENRNSIPSYDYQRCLRCYCCQELCPEGAIALRSSLPGRFLGAFQPRIKR